jgi:predicted nuclease of predicted toxin-antitoxin system
VKFLIDENIDRRISERLIAAGHTVRQVANVASGASDDFILQMSTLEGEIIVTDDKDFGELVFRKSLSNCGVMLLRLHGLSGDARAQIVLNVIVEYGTLLEKNFCALRLTVFDYGIKR